MPFKKVGKNKYKSPSGKVLPLKAVKAYYAGGRALDEEKPRKK